MLGDGVLVSRVKCESGQEKGNARACCVRMPSNKAKRSMSA